MTKPSPAVQQTAIIGITAVIIVALILGHNSTLLVGGLAMIAGIAGYSIRHTPPSG